MRNMHSGQIAIATPPAQRVKVFRTLKASTVAAMQGPMRRGPIGHPAEPWQQPDSEDVRAEDDELRKKLATGDAEAEIAVKEVNDFIAELEAAKLLVSIDTLPGPMGLDLIVVAGYQAPESFGALQTIPRTPVRPA